jgi:hypothetical protein
MSLFINVGGLNRVALDRIISLRDAGHPGHPNLPGSSP